MSYYGFIYNGKHSSEFDVYVKTKDPVLLPTLKKRELVIPGKHGSWDFGNNTYDNRVIQLDCTVLASNLIDLRLKARKVAAWLSSTTRQQLIFDYESDKYYMAKIYSNVGLEQLVSLGTFTLQFECEPFAYLKYDVNDIILDSDILLDNDIRLDDNYSYYINENTSFEINNFGTYEIRPVIQVTGNFTNLSITINGKTLNYTESVNNDTVIIDNDRYTVKKGISNPINKLSVVTGDVNTFLSLSVGVNTVSITGTGLNAAITFYFKPLYL